MSPLGAFTVEPQRTTPNCPARQLRPVAVGAVSTTGVPGWNPGSPVPTGGGHRDRVAQMRMEVSLLHLLAV